MIHLVGHKAAVRGLAFSPDGQTLASGSDDSSIRLWDLTAGEEQARIQGPAAGVLCVALSPDGTMLAAGYRGGHVHWWPLDDLSRPRDASFQTTDCRNVRYRRSSLLVSQGEKILTEKSRKLTGFCAEWIGWSRRKIKATSMDLHEERTVVVLLENGEIWRGDLVELDDGVLLTSGFVQGGPGDVKCRPCSDGVAMTSGNFVGLWSGRRGELPRTWRAHEAEVSQLAFLPDGSVLLSAGLDGLVKSWNLESLSERWAYDFGIGECFSIAVAPDGLTAAAGGLSEIVIWDLTDG